MDTIPENLLTRQNLDAVCGLQPSDLSPDAAVLWDAVQQHRVIRNPKQIVRDSNLHRWILVDLLSSLHLVTVDDSLWAKNWVLDPNTFRGTYDGYYSCQAIRDPQKAVQLAMKVAGNVGK